MKLRTLIFGALLLVSVLPVAILALWQYQTAIDNEFTVVENQHQVIAKNLTIALERYANDIRSAFLLTTENLSNANEIEGLGRLLRDLHFHHVCAIDANGKIQKFQCALTCPSGQQFPKAVLLSINDTLQLAKTNRSKAYFTNIVPNGKKLPAIYIVRALPKGNFAIGEITPRYLIELQKAVSFGEKGHAAIVDKTGVVIAHPRLEWVKSMKDLSGVSVVQQMINGESGVTRFYSPALEADMVAGFNVVPGVGWGVMVPQPEREIYMLAASISKAALTIAILVFFVALFISWWLSGILSKPLQLLSAAAHAVADGNLSTRLDVLPGLHPREIQDLQESFIQMIGKLGIKNNELTEMTSAAISASDHKSEFITSMNHELRTPMNSVLGFAQMLELNSEEPLSEKQKLSVENIIRNGNHLIELVDQMLDFNSIEAGTLPFNIEDVPARDIIDQSLSLIQARSSEANIEIMDQTLEEELPLLSTDSTRLTQVLLNLLTNAIKYNQRDGSVRLSSRRTAEQMLRISIADTGVGISHEQRENPFKPFERLGHELGQIEGTGIGLTISKKIIDLLGGRVGFESEQGKGSTFWVEIPLSRNLPIEQVESDPTIIPAEENLSRKDDGSACAILYIEDNPENLKLMQSIVEEIENTELLTAYSATAGFDIATSKQPDLILMDINLPGMNGTQALKQLRKTRQTRKIPVFALTSNSLPKDIEAGLEAGFDDYITKPIKIPDFLLSIEKSIGKFKKTG
jgi:signal transduction histidine kinase/CheY-like chemotaxis protein